MRRTAALAIGILCAACASGNTLRGTWRVVRYEVWEGSKITEPLGASPQGYLVFDGTGRAFVQLMQPGSAASFGAYHGPYEMLRGDTIAIRVEGANIPEYVGTVQKRPFRIAGDTLRLGVAGEYRATLVRVPRSR